MSDLPADEVDIVEDPDEVHKIYKQSFIDEQVHEYYKLQIQKFDNCIHEN